MKAKSDQQAQSEATTEGMLSEANYTATSTLVSYSLQKAMQLEGCVSKYRLALLRARNAFEDELQAIEKNFDT